MSKRQWVVWFAWRPVMTIGGRMVWMREVERRWNWDLNPWAYGEYSGTDGAYEYRFPKASSTPEAAQERRRRAAERMSVEGRS